MSKTELIDKRMLIDALNRVAMFHHETHIPMVEHDFRDLIDNIPTAGDIPVVRCHECKYYTREVDRDGDVWECCHESGRFTRADEYCSLGERKRKDGTK